ncbi:MAG: BREX-1 system adenine-specific DNA-methyltransferase PglX [Peptostreptococcus sp.]|uniref:BREX-1 system adenine-specific DNA-methyltransferase PglX n=1 Tax=Peptostreptococcus TaxID=1257 RepID=UPI00290C306F|nr:MULTISPECIES: BREX-1 system adenine-specific DNA-methyltransferase PglX [Peptostreptococcus]MDU3429040.1 BREX-1 system adenine-specific DNA-methyltransferase PglX [Peptostreptococcus sp.]MDU3455036.1 BREX-1 system adenine-specific DNA-methyltransferase PglX [Peptostreptococcus sp.]MDU5680604.1 BREX-1 system adenine-specific DNA-methyltransferase PglX [Peptostreptococcus sp.]MDU5738526.1 BREX-1 system adenine-specific DNA-methyltransferase PglX [Peptostreptococcus sp.]MDU5987464.1 BREX-1 sys
MNKTAIRKFAEWAREKLISDITYKASMLGITKEGIADKLPQSTNDLHFYDIGTKDYVEISGKEIAQRSALVSAIKQKEKDVQNYTDAFQYVVEEVAYTWFNRLIAIRFMEVNDYLPSGVRVLSSENKAKKEPDLVTIPFDTDLKFTPYEQDKIIQLKDDNKLDELFRMLFIKQCNKLHDILPELFEKIDDYSELLLTVSFTDNEGVVFHLVQDIAEDDFNIEKEGQVEIIGWMYQYYNSEPKDILINAKKQYHKDDIPFVTQLFTSDWIVKYLTENTLGRYWKEANPEFNIPDDWKFYIDEVEDEKNPHKLSPESIKVFDPCMGSGHILVYSFEILMKIYDSCGYSQRDAAKLILEKNIYGLDIDKRAYQLAYFSLLMQARKYNRRILNSAININLACIEDAVEIDSAVLDRLGREKITAQKLIDIFKNAKEYGSLLYLDDKTEINELSVKLNDLDDKNEYHNLIDYMDNSMIINTLKPLLKQAEILSNKYDVVITNPPYMATKYMTPKLKEYVSDRFKEYKSDLFASFLIRCSDFCISDGHIGMLTPYVWMFIQSYVELRKYIYNNMTFSSLVQLEFNAFESACVPVAAFTFRNKKTTLPFEAIRLSEFKGINVQEVKTLEAIKDRNCGFRFTAQQEEFSNIPGSPVAYWVSHNMFNAFKTKKLGDLAKPRQGMATSDNKKFLRAWYEVESEKICYSAHNTEEALASHKKWFPYNKGGGYRKWYGNNEFLVNWENDGAEIKALAQKLYGCVTRTIKNLQFFFNDSITWTFIAITPGFRYCNYGFAFDVAGSSIFIDDNIKKYTLGFLCSCVANSMLNILNPTMNIQANDIKSLPLIIDTERKKEVESIVENNILLCKEDWDLSETSWDFVKNGLIDGEKIVETSCEKFVQKCINRFSELKKNEEKLNQIFLDIYGLTKDIAYEVPDETISVSLVSEEDSIKSLISYAVGCMFGRYSLDEDGLAYAGGEWDNSKYDTFIPDEDNCIPITDEEYFEDDIVGLFCAWLKKVYGEDTLEENLDFIANALGNKIKTSREVIRNYFLTDFIKDHIKTYQKRPIYWLFDSGKQNGFKALVYMHRWNADTIGNVRVEYLHRIQRVYEKEIIRMQEIIDNSHDNKEISNAIKRKEKLQKQIKETKDYDAKIAHLALSRIDIDLDDGVKVNYEKVQTADGKKMQILAKI